MSPNAVTRSRSDLVPRTHGNWPRTFPSSAAGFVIPIAEQLKSLIKESNCSVMTQLLAVVPAPQVNAIGLEFTLPPAERSLDVSICVPAALGNPFDGIGTAILDSICADIQDLSPSRWWEVDVDVTGARLGLFAGARNHEPWSIAEPFVRALSPDHHWGPALDYVAQHLQPQWPMVAHVGLFAERVPPLLAFQLPVDSQSNWRHSELMNELLRGAIFSFDMSHPLLDLIGPFFDLAHINLAITPQGHRFVGLEMSFRDTLRVIMDQRWGLVAEYWPDAADALAVLNRTQRYVTFDSFPPRALLTTISHLKLTPRGAVKAYVGAMPASYAA